LIIFPKKNENGNVAVIKKEEKIITDLTFASQLKNGKGNSRTAENL